MQRCATCDLDVLLAVGDVVEDGEVRDAVECRLEPDRALALCRLHISRYHLEVRRGQIILDPSVQLQASKR